MVLLLTFIISLLILYGIFLGGSLILQSWLYSSPTKGLVWRAAVLAAILAAFLTFWCSLDRTSPGTYAGLLDFSTIEVKEYEQFTSVKKVGDRELKTVFTKRAGGKTSSDYLDERGRPWKRSDSDGINVAILIKEGDDEIRLNAKLDEKGRFPAGGLRYIEEGGSRYADEGDVGRVFRTKSGVLFANLGLNFLHLVLWTIGVWALLRYDFWHAVSIGFPFWLLFMLAIQPAMFKMTRKTEAIQLPVGSPTLRGVPQQ